MLRHQPEDGSKCVVDERSKSGERAQQNQQKDFVFSFHLVDFHAAGLLKFNRRHPGHFSKEFAHT